MTTQPRTHRALRTLAWALAGLAVITGIVFLASARYRVALVGQPFHRAWSIQRGQFVAEWMTRGPDGSLSGFGNTGWKLADDRQRGLALNLLPSLAHSRAGTLHRLGIPLWPVGLAFAVGAWWARSAARRHLHPALCRGCGYDLGGLPAHAPCPECGAARPSMFRRAVGLLRHPVMPHVPGSRRSRPRTASA